MGEIDKKGDDFKRIAVFGLGNPGKDYALTRHNCGYRVVDELIRKTGASKVKESARIPWDAWRFSIREKQFWLVKPLTYMNLSGEAVSRFLNTRLEDPDLLLVVCDDINLPLGTLRIRKKGGSGGHNGLKSVAHNLGTDEFGRIRTGVGTPSPHEDTADYVLSRVPEKEMEFLRKVESRAAEAVLFIAENGWESAMAKFNGKVGLPEI